MQAIFPAIEGTDTFVFVISPDSVTSEICGRELAHAVTHNKRMIPVMARDVDAKAVPEALAKLNWVFFCRENDSFEVGTDTLLNALDTDLDWVHAHTRLLTRAIEWEAKGKSNSFVLRGEDLRAAEQWLAQAGTEKERQPTALQTEYIIASRKASSKRQRITLGAVSFGLVLAIVLAILAVLQREKALAQEKKAKGEASHSEYLRALSLVEDGDADDALRTLAHALESDPTNSLAGTRLINLLGQRQWPHLVAKQKHDLPVWMLKTNGDASRIILATNPGGKGGEIGSQQLFLYDAKTLEVAGKSELKECNGIKDIQVRGDVMLVTGDSAIVVLLDAKTGGQKKRWDSKVAGDDFHGTFSNDGRSAVVWLNRDPDRDPPERGSLEIVSAADGKPTFPILPLPKGLGAVMMDGAELRTMSEDGSATIYTLKDGKASPSQPFRVWKDVRGSGWWHSEFVFSGTKVVTVCSRPAEPKVEVWPVSPSGKNNTGEKRFVPNGLAKLGMDLDSEGSAIMGDIKVTSQGDDLVNIVARDPQSYSPLPRSSSAVVRSCVTQIGPKGIEEEWQSSFAPIFLLSPGILVAQDSKAFVLPFHGGSFSGPLRHEAQVTAICEIQEGLVATGSADGAVKLWNLTPAILLAAPQSGPAKRGVEDDELLMQSRSRDVEVWRRKGEYSPPALVSKGEGKEEVKIEMPAEFYEISSIELSADGKLGIFSSVNVVSEGIGAWIFSVKDGKLLSGNVGRCEWAGFSPDQKQALTIHNGRLDFWNLLQDEKGRTTFEATKQRALAQAGMTGAVVANHGGRSATRSSAGEVIVWDDAGKPLQWLRRNPLWNDVDLEFEKRPPTVKDLRICKPALSAMGNLLATAYGKAFVVWDVDAGKPLSDPVFCAGEIRGLEFSASDSTKVIATLRDGSSTSWDHATHGGSLVEADLAVLQKLALAVGNDQWVDAVPKLAADTHPALPVVAKLLEHFASQARALRENGARSAPAVPK